jgi:hypothetical protein
MLDALVGTSLSSDVGRNRMPLERPSLVGELRKSLHALARDGRDALACAPEGSCKADELALGYSNDLVAVLGSFAGEFTAEQQAALRRVDDLLSAMSGPDQRALWTDDAVCMHHRWAEVRSQARRALTGLGWEE